MEDLHANRERLIKIKALGLTLVELLIGVAIVGLLAMIAVPAYQGYLDLSLIHI